MEPITHPLFSTITGDDWKHALARAKKWRAGRKKALAEFIGTACHPETHEIMLDDPVIPAGGVPMAALLNMKDLLARHAVTHTQHDFDLVGHVLGDYAAPGQEDAAAIADRWLAEDAAKNAPPLAMPTLEEVRALFNPDPVKEAASFLGFDIARGPDKSGMVMLDATKLVRRAYVYDDSLDTELLTDAVLGTAKGWSKRMIDEAEAASIRTVLNSSAFRDAYTTAHVRPDIAADDIIDLCDRLRTERQHQRQTHPSRGYPLTRAVGGESPVGCIGHPATVRALFEGYARENHADAVTAADIVGRRVLMGIQFEEDPAMPRTGEGAFEVHYDAELFSLRVRSIKLAADAVDFLGL